MYGGGCVVGGRLWYSKEAVLVRRGRGYGRRRRRRGQCDLSANFIEATKKVHSVRRKPDVGHVRVNLLASTRSF